MLRFTSLLLLIPLTGFGQNVGIGINPTKARLEVNGSVNNTVAIFGGDSTGIAFMQNPPSIGFNRYSFNRTIKTGASLTQTLNMATGSLVFDYFDWQDTGQATQVKRVLVLQQNGNVSVNGNENNSSLFVGKPSEFYNQNDATASFWGTTYYTSFSEPRVIGTDLRDTYINAGKNGSTVFINDIPGGLIKIGDGSARVGINTNPTDVFEIKQANGRGFALINSNFNYWEMLVQKNLVEAQSDLYLYYNGGNIGNFYNGNGAYSYYSDRRMKTQIEPLLTVLPAVLALRPSEYTIKYNNPAKHSSIGLVAQEVNKLFPEIGKRQTGEDFGYPGLTDLYSINYDALGSVSIKAIQEQQEYLEELQQQVSLLRKRIVAAEAALEAKKKVTVTNK